MGIAQEYETPDAARKRESWWPHIIGAVIAVGLVGLQVFADKGSPEEQAERRHIVRTGYSHPTIKYRVGIVDSVRIAKNHAEAEFERKVGRWTRVSPEEWRRDITEDPIIGTVKLSILGSFDGGSFILSYTYSPESDEFIVTELDDSHFTYEPPNFDR